MKKQNITACIIPSSDCHLSEYVNDCFKYRAYFSGFTGSAGTLYVTENEAYLITDGRYFLQASEQLEGTGITLVRDGVRDEPNIFTLCERTLKKDDILFSDGMLMSAVFAEKLKAFADGHGFKLMTNDSPVSESCDSLPSQKFNKIYALADDLTGCHRGEKIHGVRQKMLAHGADGHVITSLEEIAWILNLRGSDIKNTPVFYGYMYLTNDTTYAFLDREAASDVIAELERDEVTVCAYTEFYNFISSIPEKKILCDKSCVNAAVISSLPNDAEIINKTDPAMLSKAIKNKTEIENLKRVHLYDGLAVTRFMHFIKNVNGGEYSEITASEKLGEFRKMSDLYIEDSFDTICAYGKNAAVVHYTATPASDTIIERTGALLVDSGGQYLGGTTDITRVFVLGETTDEFKLHYTAVCKSMLRLQSAVFRKGTKCAVLDMLARDPVWKLGLDFRHGTGHGIGYMLSVHEGPNRFYFGGNTPAMEAGMVTSDEPGLYIDGKHGIRIENEILCTPAFSSEYGEFLKFEPLTVCPVDLEAIIPEQLDESDIEALNNYHAYVFESLAPLADEDELEWLKEYTRPIKRQ